MTETMANGYSSESTQRELSNEHQHDRVKMFFVIFCLFVHWRKVTSAGEGLTLSCLDSFLTSSICKDLARILKMPV